MLFRGPHTVGSPLFSPYPFQCFVVVIGVVELAERFSVSASIYRENRVNLWHPQYYGIEIWSFVVPLMLKLRTFLFQKGPVLSL